MPAIVERYFIDGKRISSPQSGLNIIRMSNSSEIFILSIHPYIFASTY